MKRKVLCIFSFLLILVVFGTLISPFAQEEMVTLVETKRTDKSSPLNTNVGEIAIDWQTSERMLYTIVAGSGWEAGQRIAAVPSRYYNDYGTYIAIGPYSDYRYIYTASRDPVPGDRVKSVKIKYGNDTYLLWHPETLGELNKLSNAMTLLNRTENTALITCRNSANPYFEHNMWYTFTANGVGEEVRIYSLRDTQTFMEALPWIAGVFTALLCSIALWAGTFVLTRKEGRKWVWLCNGGLIALCLGAVPMLCQCFDLPASLMPKENILDISHYITTFQRITSSMEALADPSVQGWLDRAATTSAWIAGGSLLMTMAILVAEHILSKGK